MTRKQPASPPRAVTGPQPGYWRLQDAKARFSEVVRRAHSDGPQHVTMHGRDAVVILDAADFRRLQGGQTGQVLIDALQASPSPDLDLTVSRCAMPVRDVVL
ncbi:MAG: type II toxin-antitoxin system Phd/YefM family antitoxin [Leptothrix ochracea]|jgi:prevent-host-death family protein|uniref:type II toxin-antitoxin system Phd/YefM family antitoxin n=1 Tax=Leptothrix ochracea TaxID=735331 RepID=UPI0034E2ED35